MLGIVSLAGACANRISLLRVRSTPVQVKDRLRQGLVAVAIGFALLAEHLANRTPNF